MEYQEQLSSYPVEPILSHSLLEYLYDLKENLERKETGTNTSSLYTYRTRKPRDSEWDVFKKYTNPYEYIDTLIPMFGFSSQVPKKDSVPSLPLLSNPKKISVAKYKHLSRSYYKMVEIMHTFKLYIPGSMPRRPITTFHLAEGPGGFIEAIAEIRNCREDRYTGMTLVDDKNNPNIPAWKKTDVFLKKNPNVFIETGQDNTGNILHVENFAYCVQKYGSTMDFITGDGGFDFSFDFNNQENHISKLLFAQIGFALCMQREHGCFVLKIFDCFMQHTVDLLYLLSSFYERVYIFKPQTSRYANSEKYLVCKGFLFPNCNSFYSYFYDTFIRINAYLTAGETGTGHSIPVRYLRIPISSIFLSKLEEYNAIFGQQQLENIHYTLTIMENNIKPDKLNQLIKNNIQKCIQWCIKYNVEYNTIQY